MATNDEQDQQASRWNDYLGWTTILLAGDIQVMLRAGSELTPANVEKVRKALLAMVGESNE